MAVLDAVHMVQVCVSCAQIPWRVRIFVRFGRIDSGYQTCNSSLGSLLQIIVRPDKSDSIFEFYVTVWVVQGFLGPNMTFTGRVRFLTFLRGQKRCQPTNTHFHPEIHRYIDKKPCIDSEKPDLSVLTRISSYAETTVREPIRARISRFRGARTSMTSDSESRKSQSHRVFRVEIGFNFVD